MSAPAQPLPGACNICGGTRFEPGPNGRVSSTGRAPRCSGCRSLERHRQLRRVYALLPADYLAGLDVLQLSPDIGVEPSWFRSYEVSEYGGDNSLDLQAIARPDAAYDLVICNHVLEHVADDRQGLRELLRVTRADGFVQLTVPSPYTRATTRDWGYPDARAHGHYRGYGRDFLARFGQARPDATVLEVEVFDPATEAGSYVYLWTASATRAARLERWITLPTRKGHGV
ncbi:MAG TPA: methyltransferase domain-containing protein [Burkholderiales bacterium]|nr:methyltransferase domain-containing protein [Burkholderiales bacterium]